MTISPRQFIRHPIDIPIEFDIDKQGDIESIEVRDIGDGGLCFISHQPIATGEHIHIVIPICDPKFDAMGIVRWCRQDESAFVVGVAFQQESVVFAVRMVEQVCHIEDYRCHVKETKGIDLTSEQAATEWITEYAHDFPSL